MEKEIPFTGIMGNSPVDNAGTTTTENRNSFVDFLK
jgi:hypothetical protein